MKMKYILLLASALFIFGASAADAAPKSGKKAKTQKKAAADDFDIFSPTEEAEKKAAKKEAEQREAELAAEEKERLSSLSAAERREESLMAKEDTKFYIANQKKTLKILRTVRDEKSAAKAVKPLEKIYGKVIETESAQGMVTALGAVKLMEEDETKIPVHQSSRSIAAALNAAINRQIARIAELNIQHPKFNAAMKNMADAQR